VWNVLARRSCNTLAMEDPFTSLRYGSYATEVASKALHRLGYFAKGRQRSRGASPSTYREIVDLVDGEKIIHNRTLFVAPVRE